MNDTRIGWQRSAADFSAGTVSGMASIFVGMPFDTLRVRTQAAKDTRSVLVILKRTLLHEGVFGLYRGIIPPLLTSGTAQAISFASFGVARQVLSSLRDHSHTGFSLPETYAAGFFSGVVTSHLTTPVSRTKILLQTRHHDAPSLSSTSKLQPKPNAFKETIATLKWVHRHGGISSLYVGYVPTIMVESFGRGAYFTTYTVAKNLLADEKGETSLLSRALAGASAGVVGWTACYPMDVCKTRIQAQKPDQPKIYRGIWHCALTSIKEDGYRVFLRGYSVCMFRAAPVSMVTLPCFEYIQPIMSWLIMGGEDGSKK